MIRAACLLAFALPMIAAADPDPIKTRLDAAREVYQEEMKAARDRVSEWLNGREDYARKVGDKKAADRTKEEREAFASFGELPKGIPDDISKQMTAAQAAIEAAYQLAIKDYVKSQNDVAAAATERALTEVRKARWGHLELGKAEVLEGYIRLGLQSRIETRKQYTGGVDVIVIARTEKENIRLDAHRGACVIWNWEINPTELRVARPDGQETPESGSLATARVIPLKPNAWHTLKWRLTTTGMTITTDGKVVFTERKAYDLDIHTIVRLRTGTSVVDVKEFTVTPIPPPSKDK
jgi:hypothetical protein